MIRAGCYNAAKVRAGQGLAPRRSRKKATHPEDQLQKAVVLWLQIQENLGRLTYFAIHNNPRSARDGARMKQLGMRKGMPDLCIMAKGIKPLFIELKAPRGRLSDSQKIAAARLVQHGCAIVSCRSVEEVDHWVNAWFAYGEIESIAA